MHSVYCQKFFHIYKVSDQRNLCRGGNAMFTISFRLKRRTVITAIVSVLAVGILGCLILCLGKGEADAAAEPQTLYSARTDEERIEFLNSFGWEVQPQPAEVMELTIPETFDGVYKEYNEIQQRQGMDLSKYKGKRVKRWTYEITNYPDEPQVVANLLVYEDKIIGGDVSTVRLDGFMHGFAADSQRLSTIQKA
ncbi:MAG TPA: DUF4830 domain-containing protein [Firmicutes bacterium]|nr:DUF4830 domain-containing protein [Bacillota bacterium]